MERFSLMEIDDQCAIRKEFSVCSGAVMQKIQNVTSIISELLPDLK